MNKVLIILALLIAILLIVAGVYYPWQWQNKSFQAQKTKLDTQITDQTASLAAVKSLRDSNGYTPEALVTNFFNEVKNDSPDKEKLYLSKDDQNLNVNLALGFDSNLSQITVLDMNMTTGDNTAMVNVKGTWPTANNQFERTFLLIKEDGRWKINGIKSS